MLIEIRPEPFDPWAEVSTHPERCGVEAGSFGACSVFVGSMRDFNLGDTVRCMELEHYEGMTEKLLADHAGTVIDRYELTELLILHRVGMIYPGDPIVLVAAWSAHRADAFDGCRDMMEHLKSKATFWKKESLEDTAEQRWVDNR